LADRKERTLAPEIVVEKENIVLRGQLIKIGQNIHPYSNQNRIVVSVFDDSEKDFQKLLHSYTLQTKKHSTCYFITLIKGCQDIEELKKKYDDIKSLNVLLDAGQAEKLLTENDMQRKRVFYIF